RLERASRTRATGRWGALDMRYITRLGVAVTAVMGTSLAAQAADPRPPVSKEREPGYLWAGFYPGVNAGFAWSRTEVDPLGNILFCNAPQATCNAQVASIPPSIGTNGKGAMIGGQAGFNYQTGPYVLGVEADLDWTNLGASGTQGGIAPLVGFPGAFVATTGTADQRLWYFRTLSARVRSPPA